MSVRYKPFAAFTNAVLHNDMFVSTNTIHFHKHRPPYWHYCSYTQLGDDNLQPVTPAHSYQTLLQQYVINNALSINTRQITRYRDFHQVTTCGKAVMRQAMTEHSVLTLEHLLVQELPPNERVLNDGQPKYIVIDGNHRLTTCCEMFPDCKFEWSCNVVRVHCLLLYEHCFNVMFSC
jgi:uncharacterized ParB-like nuclease family protein